MRIDLHTHSTVSDGTGAPAQVMREAAAAGLHIVALTDHDSVDGWESAAATAADAGLGFVPGIEVSCRHAGVSIHLLSYWHQADDPEVTAMLATTREARLHRAREIVAKVGVDFPVTWDAVAELAGGAATVGRPHIADALVAQGVVPTRDEAFDRILAGNSRYYVPHYAPEVTDAVRTMSAAGGVTVFAHPGADARGRIVTTSVIESMARAGLVGLEIDHRDHDERQRERLARIATRLGLVRTGSSDYHGTGKRNELGENLTDPKAFLELEKARATGRASAPR
ncbi:PHP domain-containing protein [Demequina sp. SO4-13]|uniref:PHP domain-containing protein n=1 Tax=Demequina sp. SO4-13 TaxID=3401027 RepID=UPI003AF7C56A